MPLRTSRLFPALPLAFVLACSSGSGGGADTAAPAPVPVATAAPPIHVERGGVPSFEGSATGNGWIDGTATAASSTRYFREVGGVRGRPFELKGDATGDEQSKACGTDWRASAARSVVLVTPDAGRGTVGFTLNATATARRGFWRTKATLSCTTLNYTEAQAATMARGQAWIALGGGDADRDELVIETGGATTGEWALSVTDSAGARYTTTDVGSTLVAPVPGAGSYSVAASVTARANSVGSKDSVEQRLRATVRVSSARNAMAEVLGNAPLRNLDAGFTVDVPAEDLASAMQAALAGYHPCGAKPGCGGKVSDISVASVVVNAEGGGAAITMTVAGKKRSPLAVVLLAGVAVRDDSLRLTDMQIAANQHQVLKKHDLTAAVHAFAERASAVAVPLSPSRATMEAQVRSHFPVHVGDLCIAASATPATFLGTMPAPDSTTFQAVFGVRPEPPQPCSRSR